MIRIVVKLTSEDPTELADKEYEGGEGEERDVSPLPPNLTPN